jgi:dihydroneopterin aldolase
MGTPDVVVKVGGSLFDLPDLGLRLQAWLTTLQTSEVLLVPGGGITADAVRQLDRWQGLGEECSHWLALRAMALNAWLLAAILPSAVVVGALQDFAPAVATGKLPILDANAFCQDDEARPGRLLPNWAVTSDSIAARVAGVWEARRLVLLKSVPLPGGDDWEEAEKRGLVDSYFRRALGELALTRVSWVCFRQ